MEAVGEGLSKTPTVSIFRVTRSNYLHRNIPGDLNLSRSFFHPGVISGTI